MFQSKLCTHEDGMYVSAQVAEELKTVTNKRESFHGTIGDLSTDSFVHHWPIGLPVWYSPPGKSANKSNVLDTLTAADAPLGRVMEKWNIVFRASCTGP